MILYSCNGFFESVLPKYGYPLRLPQLSLTNNIFNAIDGKKVLIAEAEVGTGKTFAYLFPALLFHMMTGGKILISTKTIELQEQLINKDIPKMIEMMKRATGYSNEIQVLLRKGKNNYICEDKLFASNNSKAIIGLSSIVNEYMYNGVIDRRKLSVSLPDKDWNNISAHDCIKSVCKNRECKFREFKSSTTYDVLVCNHSYMLSCLQDENNSIMNDASILIFDEAHSIEETAYEMFGHRIDLVEFEKLLKRNELSTITSCEKAISYCIQLFELLYKYTQFPEIELNDEFPIKIEDTDIQDAAKKLKIELNAISDNYNIHLEMQNSENSMKGEHINRVLETLMGYMDQINDHDRYIWWTSRSKGNSVCLYNTPKNVSEILNSMLFQKRIPIIFTSGTMSAHLDSSSTENNFDYFESAIGISDLSTSRVMNPIQIKSDFDYANNGLLYIEREIDFVSFQEKEKHEQYLKALALRITSIIKLSGGRTLILFTSKHEMRFTYDLIHNEIEKSGYPCYIQEGGNGTIKAKERFEKDISSCLFSASYWEGIDVKGESLSTVIIHKLPYPSPSPSFNYRKSVFKQEGNNDLRDIEMLTKLRQGAGRLIRDKTDMGVVAILDSRANKINRRGIILSNLPPFKTITNLNEIYSFLSPKKAVDI